jgi:hypothetical protein
MPYHQVRILCAPRDKIAENERGCPFGHRARVGDPLPGRGLHQLAQQASELTT